MDDASPDRTHVRRFVRWLRDKVENKRGRDTDTDPWWVTLLLDIGRPLVAVMILAMCAPGEHYLAVQAGWSDRLAWGMPGTLTAYAGIAAVVATKRPKDAPGRMTAVWGAIISVSLAMAAQPVAHLYGRTGLDRELVILTCVMGVIPGAVFGHLLHMGASAPKNRRSMVSEVPAQTVKEKRISLVKPYPAGPVGQLLSNPESALLEIKGRGVVHSPVVYFVRNGNRVKIGTTTNMIGRLRNLSLRMGDILLMLHGEFDLENALHGRFTEQRVGTTEWFELSGELVDYIEWKSGQALNVSAPKPVRPAVPDRDKETVPVHLSWDGADIMPVVPATPEQRDEVVRTVSRAFDVPSDMLGPVVPPRPAPVPDGAPVRPDAVPSLADKRELSVRAHELASAGQDKDAIKDTLRTEFPEAKADSIRKAAGRAADKASAAI